MNTIGRSHLKATADAAPWRISALADPDGDRFTPEFFDFPIVREVWGKSLININHHPIPSCGRGIARSPRPWRKGAGTVAAKPSCRILVADDDKDFANSLAVLLSLLGHEVFISRSALEALHTALTYRPDVALIDLMLPGMDGCQLARVVREHAELKEMVLIAVSEVGHQAFRRRAHQAGYAGHLPKRLIRAQLEAFLAALG